MRKVLISLPEPLAKRMCAVIPARSRSKIIASLIEAELVRREQQLYECAVAVERDAALRDEMSDWNEVAGDGLDDESW